MTRRTEEETIDLCWPPAGAYRALERIRTALKLPAGTTPADVAHAVENLVERAR